MLVLADARALPVASGTVQCCITSPPYWGLRDYGVSGQLGLEATPDAYVAALVGVFREVRRVLADTGVVFLNLGDSYAGTGAVAGEGWDGHGGVVGSRAQWAKGAGKGIGAKRHHPPAGLKPKDLVGIPWRVAFALQADGWYLRQDIIWHKPNPMPESVRDRCTKAHEYVFLLTKSQRYYWDATAMQEPATSGPAGTVRSDQSREMRTPIYQSNRGGRSQEPVKQGAMGIPANGQRNRRSVWTIPTRPFAGAHFATFPPALVEPCVLATSRPGDLVLDPFGGAGTTAVVARTHGRRVVSCDINQAYLHLARARLASMQPRLLTA